MSYALCWYQNLKRWTHWCCHGNKGKTCWGYQQSEWKLKLHKWDKIVSRNIIKCTTIKCGRNKPLMNSLSAHDRTKPLPFAFEWRVCCPNFGHHNTNWMWKDECREPSDPPQNIPKISQSDSPCWPDGTPRTLDFLPRCKVILGSILGNFFFWIVFCPDITGKKHIWSQSCPAFWKGIKSLILTNFSFLNVKGWLYLRSHLRWVSEGSPINVFCGVVKWWVGYTAPVWEIMTDWYSLWSHIDINPSTSYSIFDQLWTCCRCCTTVGPQCKKLQKMGLR